MEVENPKRRHKKRHGRMAERRERKEEGKSNLERDLGRKTNIRQFEWKRKRR